LFLFVPQAWSLSIELLFYLLVPFIVNWRLRYLSGLFLVTFVLREIAYHHGLHGDPWSVRFFPFEVSYFLVGLLSYLLSRRFELQTNARWRGYCCLAVFVVLMMSFQFVNLGPGIKEKFLVASLAVMLPNFVLGLQEKQV